MWITDEDALRCDLAETYHVLDPKALPVSLLATLSFGLRENSRIKMRLAETETPPETLLLAEACDCLRLLVWAETEDGAKNRNRPQSIVQSLQGSKEQGAKNAAFESGDDFEAAWQKLSGGE